MSESNIALDSVIELQRQYRFQCEAGAAIVRAALSGRHGQAAAAAPARFMKRVDGKTTVEGIVQDLQQTFPGVELRQDVIEFLEVAYGKRLDPHQVTMKAAAVGQRGDHFPLSAALPVLLQPGGLRALGAGADHRRVGTRAARRRASWARFSSASRAASR